MPSRNTLRQYIWTLPFSMLMKVSSTNLVDVGNTLLGYLNLPYGWPHFLAVPTALANHFLYSGNLHVGTELDHCCSTLWGSYLYQFPSLNCPTFCSPLCMAAALIRCYLMVRSDKEAICLARMAAKHFKLPAQQYYVCEMYLRYIHLPLCVN